MKCIESRFITTEVDSVVFTDIDFVKHPYQTFKIITNGGGAALAQTSLRINSDAGANYDVYYAVFSNAGYTFTSNPGENEFDLGPGYSPGVEITIMDVSLLYDGSKTDIGSKVYTNGSNSGDIHFVAGNYTQSTMPTRLELFMNLDGLFGTGKWGIGSSISLFVPEGE